MDVTPLVRKGQQIIQSYAGGGFRVSGKVYDGAVIVFPAHTAIWTGIGPGTGTADLEIGHFGSLLAHAADLDVVLLGTGKTMAFPALALRRSLREGGLAVEAMDTGAACRTWNVLIAEGRRVAAALLPV